MAADDTARLIAVTITKHLRELETASLRKNRIGKMLDSRGRIKFNNGGLNFDWNVRYRNHPVGANNGATPREFNPENLFKRCTLEYRGYQLTDAISKREKLANTGREALVKVYSGMIKRMGESLDEALSQEWYIDGSATGNDFRFHGLNSIIGTPTQTYSAADGTARTANAADVTGVPVITDYAGLSTVPGAYGGSAPTYSSSLGLDSVWPAAPVDPEYDFFSPLIVNYTSTAFNGSANTWDEQCIEALRFMIAHVGRNKVDSMADMVLMARPLFIKAQNKLDAKERVAVTATNGLKSYGFKDVFEIDGTECSTEYYTPAGRAYLFSIENMELLSMQDGLSSVEGPEYDIDTQHDKFVNDVLGNLKFKTPRNFGVAMALAS